MRTNVRYVLAASKQPYFTCHSNLVCVSPARSHMSAGQAWICVLVKWDSWVYLQKCSSTSGFICVPVFGQAFVATRV